MLLWMWNIDVMMVDYSKECFTYDDNACEWMEVDVRHVRINWWSLEVKIEAKWWMM